jgi:lambda family phage portal protein
LRKKATTTKPPAKRVARPKQAPRTQTQRMWDAARIDRLTQDWVFSHQSINKELQGGLVTIRARARSMEQNENIARRYLALVEANVVGSDGFQLRLKGGDAEQAQRVADGFRAWMDKADVLGMHSGPDMQRLIIRSTARDGECLARFYRGRGYPDGLGVQVLESDWLDEQNNKPDQRIYLGVKLDGSGKPAAYYLLQSNPQEYYAGRIAKPIPARDIVHVFRPERPGQWRAVSWMASAMMGMHMLKGYQEAELVAARVSSCQMGFYKIPPGENWANDGQTVDGAPVTDASPGAFERLPQGWDFQPFNPAHPTSQYGAFVKEVKREISSGLIVSYSALCNDGSEANYSSMREMSLIERENWRVVQNWFARLVMRRLYREWIDAVELTDTFDFPVAPFRELDEWAGKRWPWVDPLRDSKSTENDIRMGLVSPSQVAAERGVDYVQTLKQIQADDISREVHGMPSMFADEKPVPVTEKG